MKIIRSWLEEYLPSMKNKSNEEIAEIFHLAGIEVEGIEAGLHENVVVAKIIKIDKHPDADRLNLAEVTDGVSNYKIVCGAPNIKTNQVVPLAKIGAILPGGFEIKKAKIRGVESDGMLCAADEIGIGSDHSGIIELSDEYQLGKPLRDYISKETIFDISITPNRGDWLSHFGVARELGAFTNIIVKKSPISLHQSANDVKELLNLEVENTKKCPQYYARVIKGIKIAKSPKWLRDKLEASGVRSINNVVDVTNLILLDFGHPLHAFDYQKIAGKTIVVRSALDNEKIETLDGVTRELDKNDLVIADKDKAIAIAGVMGGLNSEVTNKTTNVVLEAAVFDPASIRKTSKRLKLQSEANYRFERGIDEGGTEYVINKAANLIMEVAGGIISKGILKSGQTPQQKQVKIDYSKINNLLGVSLQSDEINHYLKLLGFEIKDNTAIVPLWRNDVSIIQDLAEEVGRLHGYDNIVPVKPAKETPPKKSIYYSKQYLKEIIAQNGFSETISYPYLSQKDIDLLNIKSKDLLEVVNPLQDEYKYLRTSLIPGLIKAIAKNPAFDPTLLFEISHVYTKDVEQTNLAIVSSGKNAKKILEDTLNSLEKNLGKSISKEVDEFPREQLVKFKVKKPAIYTFEIDTDELLKKSVVDDSKLKLKISNKEVTYRPISRFPMITRDLAFIVDKSVDAQELSKDIYKISDLINRVELFDEFASDKFGLGKKNIAYHIYLQHIERTLVDSEADKVVKDITDKIEKEYKATLRGK